MSFRKSLIVFVLVIATAVFFYKSILPITASKLRTAFIGTIVPVDTPELATIADRLGPSIIAIQSFSGGKLLRAGSGLVLTQDGLVITLNSLVPPEADFYQVLIDDKLDRGRVLMRDNKNNLAVVSVDDRGFTPMHFGLPLISTSESLLVVVQRMDLDKSLATVEIIPMANIKQSANEFLGGVAVTQSGQAIGLVDTNGGSLKVISASRIEELFSVLLKSKINE